jgi:CDP-diacylglycerol--glycerol-3-phosphate 3-phosphatidyltransferase
MLDNIVARASVGRVTDPVGRTLVRWGVPPDLVTVVGTVGSVAAALWFLPRGQLFLGVCVTTAFVLFDLVDGAMARALGSGTRFGAVLDSTCDRLADGALFAALAWWCLRLGDQPHTAVAAMISLVAGQVVSYLKARAEASGLSAQGGLVERAERLILALVGTALEGLGLVGALAVGLWLLSVGSLITLGQRLLAVHRSARAQTTAELDADRKPDLVAEPRPDREPEPDAGSATPDDGSVTR